VPNPHSQIMRHLPKLIFLSLALPVETTWAKKLKKLVEETREDYGRTLLNAIKRSNDGDRNM